MAAIAAQRANPVKPLGGEDAASEQNDRLKLMAALRKGETEASAGDSPEPDWPVLARWIDDTAFVQIVHRCEFLSDLEDTPPDGYIKSVWPLVEKHRLRAVLDAFHGNKAENKVGIDALKKLNLHGLDLRAERIAILVNWFDYKKANIQGAELHAAMDNTLNDRAFLWYLVAHITDRFLKSMSRISPHNPLATATMIERHWDKMKAHSDDYTQLVHEQPRVALAVGRGYEKSKDYAKAEDAFKWAVALDSKARRILSRLSHVFLLENKLDRFLDTCQTCLRVTSDFGLQHADMEDHIASAYLRRGQWKQAEKFAEEAAECGLVGPCSSLPMLTKNWANSTKPTRCTPKTPPDMAPTALGTGIGSAFAPGTGISKKLEAAQAGRAAKTTQRRQRESPLPVGC